MLSKIKAILELAKIRIIIAVGITGYAGMVLTNHGNSNIPDTSALLAILILSGIGSKLLNNLSDYEMDAKMDRTLARKEAIDKIGRKNLWIIALILCLISLIFSYVYFNIMVMFLVLAAILSYAIWYTFFLKRKDPFGVILGGIPGAMPILIGSYAVVPEFRINVGLLFLFMMLWQPPHFWALTLKLKEDYANANVPVFSVVFGEKYTRLFIYLYAMTLLPVTIFLGIFSGFSQWYFIFATILGFYYIIATLYHIEVKKFYGWAFADSLFYMILFFLLIILEVHFFIHW